MKPAIRVENLAKSYRLGSNTSGYRTLRETITNAAANAWYGLRSRRDGSKNGTDQDNAFWALKDVSFEVQPGEVVGIIGRNGAGKSTLLKILSRITEPSEGRCEVRGRIASLLEVGTGFHPELSGRENIYMNGSLLGMSKKEINRKFDKIVEFSEIQRFLDTPVKRYSSGMYVRLAFAVAAHLESEILVIDEVLAVGDILFQKKCLAKMDDVAHQGRTVLFVSHNLIAVNSLCNRTLLVDRGRLIRIGKTRDVVGEFEKRMFSNNGSEQEPHVLYEKPDDKKKEKFEITRIELVDSSGNPKPMVSTWDDVTLRVHYEAQEYVQDGSMVIFLNLMSGTPLLLLSTQPDSNVPMPIVIGEHYVDCHIKQLPLAGGRYVIGAGLAVPNKRYLCKEDSLAQLTVFSRDVFGSELHPTMSRALLAVPHTWSIH